MTDQTQAAEPFSTTPPAAPAPAVPYEAALSWGGFNLYGDRKSIEEAKRLKHDADTVPELKRAYASLLAATPAAPTVDHFESTTLEAIIQQYGIDRDDANWLRSMLPSVATQTTAGEIVPTAEQPNLSDPAVQKRLAAQWGYVLPTAAPVDEREAFEKCESIYRPSIQRSGCTPKDIEEMLRLAAWSAWQARASLQSVDDATTKEIPLLSDDEMPPLPEPVTIDTHESGYRIRGYTAEQMRDYARKAHP